MNVKFKDLPVGAFFTYSGWNYVKTKTTNRHNCIRFINKHITRHVSMNDDIVVSCKEEEESFANGIVEAVLTKLSYSKLGKAINALPSEYYDQLEDELQDMVFKIVIGEKTADELVHEIIS